MHCGWMVLERKLWMLAGVHQQNFLSSSNVLREKNGWERRHSVFVFEKEYIPSVIFCDGHLYGQIKQIFTSPEKDLNYGVVILEIN